MLAAAILLEFLGRSGLSAEKQKHTKSGSKATGGFVVLFFYNSYVR